MKNLHALTEGDRLVHINQIIKGDNAKYYCVQCGDELIARKGDVRTHHFAHKNNLTCSYESYLHKLAKRKFYDAYKECLEQNRPFLLEYRTNRECKTCITINPFNHTCKLEDEVDFYNLTRMFDQIQIEKKVDQYIADVLLFSSTTDEVVLVEFAVKHKCDASKIQSGYRIIEYHIKEEDDIDDIIKSKIPLFHNRISRYNFRQKTREGDLRTLDNCDKKYRVFYVYKSGKAFLKTQRVKDSVQDYREKVIIHAEIEPVKESMISDDFYFLGTVRKASKDGIRILNCFACRLGIWKGKGGRSFYCSKKQEKIGNSNNASECNYFDRIEYAECVEDDGGLDF